MLLILGIVLLIVALAGGVVIHAVLVGSPSLALAAFFVGCLRLACISGTVPASRFTIRGFRFRRLRQDARYVLALAAVSDS